MAGIIYLDIDDEITSAATRIRDAKDARVALVLPAGSRVATSRINFRLLARAVDSPATASAILTPVPREPEARPARPLPTIEGGRRRGRAGLFVLIGLLALGLVVAGVAGYLLLPSASIVVTPHAETIGPLQLSVRADPAAIGVDPAGDVVPAQPATIPLSASGDFPATGTKVKE